MPPAAGERRVVWDTPHPGKGLRPLHSLLNSYIYCMFLDKDRPYVDKLVLIASTG